jgi:hypothetical protein
LQAWRLELREAGQKYRGRPVEIPSIFHPAMRRVEHQSLSSTWCYGGSAPNTSRKCLLSVLVHIITAIRPHFCNAHPALPAVPAPLPSQHEIARRMMMMMCDDEVMKIWTLEMWFCLNENVVIIPRNLKILRKSGCV